MEARAVPAPLAQILANASLSTMWTTKATPSAQKEKSYLLFQRRKRVMSQKRIQKFAKSGNDLKSSTKRSRLSRRTIRRKAQSRCKRQQTLKTSTNARKLC